MTERFKTDEKLINKIIPFIPDIEIVFDEDTEDGTIVLDNGSEIVDASIPTQLDFLKEILNNTSGGSNDDESFELGNAPDSIFSGGAEISEEFPAEFSSEISGDAVETAGLAENAEAEASVDFAAEALAGIAEAEAAVQNAAEAIDDGFAGSLLEGGMGSSEDIPMDNPADDFVSAVSEALPASEVDEAAPAAEVVETKKTTKKRAKKSEE